MNKEQIVNGERPLLLCWNDYYRAWGKAIPMRTLAVLALVNLSIAGILTGCQKELSYVSPDNTTTKNSPHTFAISFPPGTISIASVDSVVVDLINSNAANYRHLTLEKMGTRFVSVSKVPEMGYDAYIIIYLHPENTNSSALLYHQVYGGGNEAISKAAPKTLTDEAGWQLMGRTFSRENEFFALVGVSPTNPLLYLFTNVQKRDYIYVDKSYLNSDQSISNGSYEYRATTPLSHPIAIKDAFQTMATQMQGKTWTTFSSMAFVRNTETAQENSYYFEYMK